jgi:HD-like signal output (HDOD) protein
MELILDVRRVGSDREREFLGGLIPLLGVLVLHALFEIFLALFAECCHRQ